MILIIMMILIMMEEYCLVPRLRIISRTKIIDYLNDKTNKYYKHTTGKTRRFIEARWNEEFN